MTFSACMSLAIQPSTSQIQALRFPFIDNNIYKAKGMHLQQFTSKSFEDKKFLNQKPLFQLVQRQNRLSSVHIYQLIIRQELLRARKLAEERRFKDDRFQNMSKQVERRRELIQRIKKERNKLHTELDQLSPEEQKLSSKNQFIQCFSVDKQKSKSKSRENSKPKPVRQTKLPPLEASKVVVKPLSEREQSDLRWRRMEMERVSRRSKVIV